MVVHEHMQLVPDNGPAIGGPMPIQPQALPDNGNLQFVQVCVAYHEQCMLHQLCCGSRLDHNIGLLASSSAGAR